MFFVVNHYLLQSEHDFLNIEFVNFQVKVNAIRALADNSSFIYAENQIVVAARAHAAISVLVARVHCLDNLVEFSCLDRLTDLVVGHLIELAFSHQLLCYRFIHLLQDFQVNLIPVVDSHFW